MLNLGRSALLWTLLAAIALVVGCGSNCEVKPGEPFTKAVCRIEELMEKEGIAAYQVAVAKDGEILFEAAFGLADVAAKVPATAETMFLVASIEKPFVTTALMILSEQGRIDLAAPVNDYLSSTELVAYQGDASDATIARLLMHTTGMPYGYYIAGDDVPEAEKRSAADLVDIAGVLVTAPGSKYQYTNIGYGLFDNILEDALDEDLKEFILREVVKPLGLEHTRYFDAIPPVGSVATQNADAEVLPVAFDSEGHTAWYSTAGDLARFGMFHLKAHLPDQEAILTDSSIDMMWQYREPNLKISTRRIGWDVQQDFGFETVQHGGGGPGIHNWLYMIPSENIVIAILSNARYSSPKQKPVLVELISAALADAGRTKFIPDVGRGWPTWPRLDPSDYRGTWTGNIIGPKGEGVLTVRFDSGGKPSLRIEGDRCSDGDWVKPSRRAEKSNASLLWRFDACIPYLQPYAIHDEVILTVWPQGEQLIGHLAAAKEKNFGHGENYVLPQYVELAKMPGD